MPVEHVEIENLNRQGRERVRDREAERRWLEEHRAAKAADYADFRSRPGEYQPWRKRMDADLDAIEQRRDAQRKDLPELLAADQKLFPSLAPDALLDSDARSVRDKLDRILNDSELEHGGWDLPLGTDAQVRAQWDKLLEIARAPVERNGDRLATCIADAVTLCSDRIRNEGITVLGGNAAGQAAVDAWKKSELVSGLSDLQAKLSAWDALLAREPFPSADELLTAADACAKALNDVSVTHRRSLTDKTSPSVRFQLLATLRAVSESLGQRLVLRVNPKSCVSAFNRLCEFPASRGPDACKAKAAELRAKAGGSKSLGSVWTGELESVRDAHKHLLRNALMLSLNDDKAVMAKSREHVRALDDVLAQLGKARPKIDLAAALKDWGKAHERLADPNDDEAVEDLNRLAGEITHGLKRHLEVLNAHLLNADAWGSDAAGRKLQQDVLDAQLGARERYRELMDGIVRICQEDMRAANVLLSNR